jgi:transcriptional regulator with XRE-family HTH domain
MSAEASNQRLERTEQPNPAAARRIRERFGWSRQQMAAELGVAESSIVRWERGTAAPAGGRLRDWVRLLDRMTAELDVSG